MPTSPTLFYDIAVEALAAAVDGLHAVLPEPFWHEHQSVVNGPPAWDGWEGCAVAVLAWAEFVTPTTTPPAPAAGVVLGSPPWPMVQVVVATIRCEPTIGDDATFPTPTELDNAARLNALDGFVVWNALAQYALAQRRLDEETDVEGFTVAMGLSTPIAPAGGLVGWETRMVVIPTDPSCPGDALADVPEEWWPVPEVGY